MVIIWDSGALDICNQLPNFYLFLNMLQEFQTQYPLDSVLLVFQAICQLGSPHFSYIRFVIITLYLFTLLKYDGNITII